MPAVISAIEIHFSAPADLREEVALLEKVVADLEREVQKHYMMSYHLVRWEDSAVSATGRPQEIVNRQIGYRDIFIGILGSRFGTREDLSSRTEKEFARALDSWQLLGRPHVLFYFNDQPIRVSQIDPSELLKVNSFRDSVIDGQAPCSSYSGLGEFESLVRRQLAKALLGEAPEKKAARVFYSYAREDEVLREQLAKHLRVLERNRIIESWYDDMIAPGAEWADRIADEMRKADIIVLLVSSDFLDSEYCYKVEMQEALKRHEAGKVRVMPIIVRSAIWEESPLASLKALPKDRKPITLWADRDEAWTDVARGIRSVALELEPE